MSEAIEARKSLSRYAPREAEQAAQTAIADAEKNFDTCKAEEAKWLEHRNHLALVKLKFALDQLEAFAEEEFRLEAELRGLSSEAVALGIVSRV